MGDKKEKIMIPGLVLEGGGMRGMYTVGILDAFMEAGISAEKIVGVSAGALLGINLLSEQKGRGIRYSKRFNGDKKYMGLIPLLREGNIVSTEYAYERVPRQLDPFDDETFMASSSRFYAVITNIETGEPEYVHIKSVFNQMDTLRASGSMPFVSKPVEILGKKYLDGGISDSIPVDWMMKQGAGKVVVVLTRDISYEKKPESTLFTLPYRKKYPVLAKRMLQRYIVYNEKLRELQQLEKEGRVFVIRPSEPIRIKRTERDPEKLQDVYELGKKDGEALMEPLKSYLSLEK